MDQLPRIKAADIARLNEDRCGNCGELLRFLFIRVDSGIIWHLLAFDPQRRVWRIRPDKRCPHCRQSSAKMDAAALDDALAESMARL